MKNKLFIASLAAAVAVPAIVAPMQGEASTNFKDTSSLSSSAKEKITQLVEQNVISGFPDNTFRPMEKVTRGQFASFISRALELPMPVTPKTFKDVTTRVSTYEGIVKAYQVGIVSGFPDGTYHPNDLISRAEMAIMLDRALQYKSSFAIETQTLPYSDKNSIGKSAIAAVKRLHYYGILSELTGSAFSPSTKGDRLQTVQSIYEIAKLKGLFTGDTIKPSEPEKPSQDKVPFKKDSRDYTFEEVKQLLPPTTRIERREDGSVVVTDMVKEYYDGLQSKGFAGYTQQPLQFFNNNMLSMLHSTHQVYRNAFPEYELIALNGVPYRDTEYFPEYLKNPIGTDALELNGLVAKPPKEAGKFLIDIGTKNYDVVTYAVDEIKLEKAGVKPLPTATSDFLVDIQSAFNDTDLVNVSDDGLVVTYADNTLTIEVGSNEATLNGKSVTLSATVREENERIIAPIQSIATQLGLSSRKLDKRRDHSKIEIANYYLPVFELDSEGNIISEDELAWER